VKPTPEITAKAAELTKNAPNDEAKLHALYSYVSTQFHYIGVAFGIGRYQPHSAAEVLANQYGDCKDKHTLLASLLAAVGIPAYPALISTSREVDGDVPSPGQFDHVITFVPREAGPVWLDTTTEVGPYQYLASPLRDKHALAIWKDKPPALVNTR
jgi:transglutaminase-like putative cysteine protease